MQVVRVRKYLTSVTTKHKLLQALMTANDRLWPNGELQLNRLKAEVIKYYKANEYPCHMMRIK